MKTPVILLVDDEEAIVKIFKKAVLKMRAISF